MYLYELFHNGIRSQKIINNINMIRKTKQSKNRKRKIKRIRSLNNLLNLSPWLKEQFKGD